MKAHILTPWKQTGSRIAPQLEQDHPLPLGGRCVDVTGQPAANLLPSPNLFTVEVQGVSSDWLNTVAADPTYVILWSE